MASNNNGPRPSEDPDVLAFFKLETSRDPKKKTRFASIRCRDEIAQVRGLRILVSESGWVTIRKGGDSGMAFK